MTSKCFSFLILLIIFFTQNNIAQLSMHLNLEGGYYRSISKIQAESGQKDAAALADAEIGYDYKLDRSIISLNLRARPEVYGFNNNLKILKLKSTAGYYLTGDQITWGLNITGQKNDYSGDNVDLNFQNLTLIFESLIKIDDNVSLSSNIGYGYQKITNDLNQKMDLFFIDAELMHRLPNNIKYGYGIYSERFTLINLYNFENINNNGWRIGPQLKFDYLKTFLINFDYKFLFHISEVTQSPSYEHRVRLVAGKLLSENWSVFILTDYYFRRYTIKENLINPYISLYTPINEDNRIYFKIGYSISDNFETYFKTGYFRENLYNNNSFAGWNVLLGFQVEN